MIYEIGIYRLEIDVPRTKIFYTCSDYTGCSCDGCRNFEKAVAHMPEEAADFLTQFGIDPGKPAEISAVYSPDGGDTLYSGFYHICGTILEGTNPWVQVAKKQFRLDERYAIEQGGFSFYFTSNCALIEKGFPSPAIQLEFQGNFPWLLDTPNPYT